MTTSTKITPQKKMTLQEYIEKHGAIKVAAGLGASTNPVYEWASLKRQPSFFYACKLIALSKGKLDFESIYRPFYSPKPKAKK